MIDMSKKYRTRDGRSVRILCTDGPGQSFTVAGYAGSLLTMWTAEGKSGYPDGQVDLIEVVPDEVMFANLYRCGSTHSQQGLQEANDSHSLSRIAITRTTIRNGGINGPSDVTVEVLPVDYKETP